MSECGNTYGPCPLEAVCNGGGQTVCEAEQVVIAGEEVADEAVIDVDSDAIEALSAAVSAGVN